MINIWVYILYIWFKFDWTPISPHRVQTVGSFGCTHQTCTYAELNCNGTACNGIGLSESLHYHQSTQRRRNEIRDSESRSRHAIILPATDFISLSVVIWGIHLCFSIFAMQTLLGCSSCIRTFGLTSFWVHRIAIMLVFGLPWTSHIMY